MAILLVGPLQDVCPQSPARVVILAPHHHRHASRTPRRPTTQSATGLAVGRLRSRASPAQLNARVMRRVVAGMAWAGESS